MSHGGHRGGSLVPSRTQNRVRKYQVTAGGLPQYPGGNYRTYHQCSGNRTSFLDLVRHLLEAPRKTWRILLSKGLEGLILKVSSRISAVI